LANLPKKKVKINTLAKSDSSDVASVKVELISDGGISSQMPGPPSKHVPIKHFLNRGKLLNILRGFITKKEKIFKYQKTE